jgi:hypothetical protein
MGTSPPPKPDPLTKLKAELRMARLSLEFAQEELTKAEAKVATLTAALAELEAVDQAAPTPDSDGPGIILSGDQRAAGVEGLESSLPAPAASRD